ncbi:MAG: IS66 family transposase [Acetobacteraceae bacterium]|nr:IS66 family transposase [Acetobacteraceae bacterium]
MRALLEAALQRIAALEAQVRDLQAQLQRNASNSSIPPSANPPNAPKPVTKTPTGRKPGGQLGHRGHHRRRLPQDRVNHVVSYVPMTSARCQGALPAEPQPGDPEPSWHQVAELPELAAIVTESQAHARICPRWGQLNQETIPPTIRAHALGPRLAAVMAYLSGRHHRGKPAVQEIVETVFQVPVSLGTVVASEQQTSAALAIPHEQARDAVRDAPVKNTDETGWKRAGQRCWPWRAATATVAYYLIHPRRGWEGLQSLLGEAIRGIICSDRWSAYAKLLVEARQLCWADLKRDFQKCVDRGGAAEPVGQAGLKVVTALFATWEDFGAGRLDRAGLQRRWEPVAQELHEALECGRGCADAKAATFCANLLALEPALWTFAAVAGVEPTNNHAERLLRSGVLWRKNAFGCHSEAGCRFVERMLTVVQTLRLQQRPVLDYLYRAVVAHRSGSPAPALLIPQGN